MTGGQPGYPHGHQHFSHGHQDFPHGRQALFSEEIYV